MLLLFTIAAFVITTGVALSGYYFLTADTPVEQRLRSVVPSAVTPRTAERPRREGPGPIGRLLTMVGALSAGNNEGSLTQLLTTAGMRSANALFLFVGARTVLSIGPALSYLVPRVSRGEPLMRTLFVTVLIWGALHWLCMFWLRRRARRRMFRVQTALPDSLDLMVVCLEAGLGLTATIADVSGVVKTSVATSVSLPNQNVRSASGH